MTIERVKKVLTEDMGLSGVTEKSNLRQLGMDSLEISQFVLELEEEFGLSIPDDDMQDLFTVEDVAKYVDTRSN